MVNEALKHAESGPDTNSYSCLCNILNEYTLAFTLGIRLSTFSHINPLYRFAHVVRLTFAAATDCNEPFATALADELFERVENDPATPYLSRVLDMSCDNCSGSCVCVGILVGYFFNMYCV